MSKCNLDYVNKILNVIDDFLFSKQNRTLESLEAYVKAEVPELEGDFLLEAYFTNKDFKESFELQASLYGLDITEFIKDLDSINVKTKNNIAPNFSSSKITDLFHTLPLVKLNFESELNGNILREILIGDGSSKSYVSSNSEISSNLASLKNRLFDNIQRFLIKKGILTTDVESLFTEDGDVTDYNHYKKVMMMLDDYFFSGENFPLIKTYSNKKGIPSLPEDLVANSDIFDAYNAGVLLSNFDTVMQEYFSGIIDINYNLFNNLRSNLEEEDKYKLRIEGLKTEYWLADSHAAEGSESAESKLTRLLVSTIIHFNKSGKDIGLKMEMKDFYLFAAMLSDFETVYGNQLKNQVGLNFKYFNENPREALLWYLDQIEKAINQENGSIEWLRTTFQKNYDFALSLKRYFHSKDLNILEKEKNSELSLITILAQIINNNFGASYGKYNADGTYKVQQMYKQNFNNIGIQNTTLSHLKRISSKSKAFEVDTYTKEVKDLLAGITEDDLIKIPTETKVKITNFIKSKTGIKLSYLGFDELINDLQRDKRTRTFNNFRNSLLGLLAALNSDYQLIQKADIADSKGDVSVTQYLPATINTAFYKALTNSYLVNYVMPVVMNVETFDKKKLPTFKMATLTQKDSELFELQRKFESENEENTKFRSLLIKNYSPEENTLPCIILGTGTKLELVNDDVSKHAVKFNVSENFTSDFQFEFLQNLIDNDQFSIMLGNYSDKNTILTKLINARIKLDKDSPPLIEMPIEDILIKVRQQAGNYYKDVLEKIFDDYAKLLDIKLSINTVPEANIKKINEKLKTINIRTLSKRASDLGINFTEELHYSRYNNGKETRICLNQLIVDNFRIFNNDKLFKEFVRRQESNMISKFQEFNKSVDGGKELVFTPGFKIKEAMKKLALTDADFEMSDKYKGEVDYEKLTGKKGTNPLLRKWMWLNALMRNEYMFISVKGEYMHPHKLKGDLQYRGDSDVLINKNEVDPKDVNAYWNEIEKEMSGRMISMAKRNVTFTATIEVPVRNSKLGIPEKVNMAVLDDYKSEVYNLSGNTKNQEVHDGSSLINYVYSLMLDNSYPAKGYKGTKKQFGTLITKHGVTIKKDAESIITNDKILNSRNSKISFYKKQKQMLDIPIGAIDFKFQEAFKDEFFFDYLGTNHRIDQLKINNNSYSMIVSKKVGEKWIKDPVPISGKFTSLFDLWKLFGAEYSTDQDGNYNEGSNELLYKIITTSDKNGNYPLKDKMIHVLSNLSAVKAGGTNVNHSSLWTSDEDLAYFSFDNRMMGPQLDPSHDADESEIKEVTQVISALAQNAQTAHLATEAYQNIANVIKNAMKPYLKYLKDGENINKNDLYKYLSDKFVRTIESSKGDSIAKVLIQSFSEDVNIPFSNQNFFTPFVRDIITRMNNEFITRYYSGTGAVLVPSHGIIQLYDIPQPNGTRLALTQLDLTKEALRSFKNFDSRKYITQEDRIVFGHPGIGKTYLHSLDNSIIDFDTIYNPLKNEFIAKSLGKKVEDLTKEERNNFKQHDPRYGTFLNSLWEKAKKEAAKEGKQLFASDLHILRNHSADFHKFITMSPETFYARSAQRGEYRPVEDALWKNDLDVALANVDQSKVINTDGYLSDLIILNNEQVVANYLKEKLFTYEVNWEEIQLGDTVEIGGQNITLSNPGLYYQYKGTKAKEKVMKVLGVARDLKPSEILFTVNGIRKNAFDLDSVRLRYELSSIKKKLESKEPLDVKNSDFIALSNLYKHFTKQDLFISLTANTEENRDSTLTLLENILTRWTQRNLELLDKGRVMKSINEVKNYGELFGKDNLSFIFKDAEVNYTDTNSYSISNYKFNAAELILGDIYLSKFNRDINDSIYEIKQQGSTYFENRIAEDYKEDDTKSDIKLYLNNSENPVYIRYVEELPGNDYRLNITLERPLEEEGVQQRFVRRNQNGEILYVIPDHKSVRVRLEDDKEIIYIKAVNTIKHKGEVHYDKVENFDKNLSDLLNSFKGNIRSFIPLMNNNLGLGRLVEDKDFAEKVKEFAPGLKFKPSKITFNQLTLAAFSKFSGYSIQGKLSPRWFNKNRQDIVSQLSKKMYASWEKSHEFVASRIPSQSMQSFMEMKNIAYLRNKSNDAYVSVWQIWLQGSDFDIDKSYILGSGFSPNGQFDLWTSINNYSSTEQLNVLEEFPLPNKINTVYDETGNGLDLTQEVADFYSITPEELQELASFQEDSDRVFSPREMNVRQLNAIKSALQKINAHNIGELTNRKDEILSTFVSFPGTKEQIEIFIGILNKHNSNTQYLHKEHALKNSIAATIKRIISTPSNQLLANSPVDIEDWQLAAKEALKKKTKQPMLLSTYDMFSMYKQQRDAAVGKDDVGIAANGLKAFFALSTYYNNYFTNFFVDNAMAIRQSNKTFNKTFTFVDANGKEKIYKIGTIADVNISNSQQNSIKNVIGEFEALRVNAALALSGFTSAATDNAKELLMAKINANVELASMHIYLMILGFKPSEIAEIMTSDIMDEVVDALEVNSFFSDKKPLVAVIFNKLIKETKDNPTRLQNLKTLQEIFEGAQEVKLLSGFLSSNQKTSANIQEINRFLTNFEMAIYGREHHVFGYNLQDFDFWLNYKDSVDSKKSAEAKEKFDKLIDMIFENNSTLDKKKDLAYVKKTLESAGSLGILGGKFDFQTYFKQGNSVYREVTKQYYNLIKSTFNLFDVIDEVPHFREMINGLVLTHTILLNSSIKYNTAFSLIKDTIRKNSDIVVLDANSHITNQMGNPALYPMITDSTVNKGLAGIDIRLKSEWLKSKNTEHLTFNVTDLLRKYNSLAEENNVPKINEFSIYTSDEARDSNKIGENSKIIKEGDTEDTIINLRSNYGIANFKILMENILLPMLQWKSNVLLDSLRVEGGIYNILGVKTNGITSTFSLSSINNAVAKDKSQKLTKAFNELDITNSTKELVLNSDGDRLKWRDLFYVYNLILNNEKYGSKRLTPLFEDYIKEDDSLGYDYVMFSSKIDKGDLNLYDLEKELLENPEYILALESDDKTTMAKLRTKIQRELENDILFYSLNKNGKLYIKTNKPNPELLLVSNGDFTVVTSITETEEVKKGWADLYEVLKLIKSRGFIIKFEC